MRVVAARGPAAHHRVGDVHVELQREGRAAVAEGLHRKGVALRQQGGAARQIEALAMPLIDLVGPVLAERAAGRRRTDRVIADLGMAVRMRIDLGAELARQHLRAEADAEIRLLLLERHLDPVDLAADEIVLVVGALRPAENHGAGMVLQRLGQRLVEARPADVEGEAAAAQRVADPAGRRVLLMQDDQDRQVHDAEGSWRRKLIENRNRQNSMPLLAA